MHWLLYLMHCRVDIRILPHSLEGNVDFRGWAGIDVKFDGALGESHLAFLLLDNLN